MLPEKTAMTAATIADEPAAPGARAAADGLTIALLSVGEEGSGALEAHVGELARRLSPHARVHRVAFVSLRAFLTRAGRGALREFTARARADLSGTLVVLPHPPRFRALWACAVALAMVGRGLSAGGPLIVHARGSLAGAVAARARRLGLLSMRLVHDVRGDRVAEIAAFGGERAADDALRLEAEACRAADACLAVSGPLRDLLRSRHGVGAGVFPCAADTESFAPDSASRAARRARLGAGDAIVIGFAGSLAPWQKPEAVIAVFRAILAVRPQARLLVLTPEGDGWARRLDHAGLPVARTPEGSRAGGATVFAARHDEVPAWLAACDATLLLRDRDAVNAVASPIKLGESLACGVPVIMTDGIGDASALVAGAGAGVVLDDAMLAGPRDGERLRAFVERLEREPDRLRDAARALAVAEWSWSVQLPRRLEAYRNVAAGGGGP